MPNFIPPVDYGWWKHSGQWKDFIKTIHVAFRNNRTINLLIRRGRGIIGGFQLCRLQNKPFPSFNCHFFYNALKNPQFTVKYYEFPLEIGEKHTKDCYFCQLHQNLIFYIPSLQVVNMSFILLLRHFFIQILYRNQARSIYFIQSQDLISRFYIREHFSRMTKSSQTKIKK